MGKILKTILIIYGLIILYNILQSTQIIRETIPEVPLVWEDERVPVTSTKLGGSKDPTFAKLLDNGTGSQGVFSYYFSASQEQELYFNLQLSHRYKPGTDLRPHVHFIIEHPEGDTGNVTWGLEYSCASPDLILPNTTILTVTEPNHGEYNHSFASFSSIDGTTFIESTMCVMRVFRDATADSDTYPGIAYLLEIDIHYLTDKRGTSVEFP